MSVDVMQEQEKTVHFEVRNLSDRLTEVVRDQILSGEIATEAPIRQDALAARLRVSKIPLREALARLEQDGLVRSHPNRGFFVTPLSAEEAEEVYALRIKLEPDAAAFACASASKENRAAARAALDALTRAAAEERPTLGAMHRAFHFALVKAEGQALTARMIARLNVIADRYVRKHLEPVGRHFRAEAEHEEILAAWVEGRADDVRELVRRHLADTLEDLRGQLRTIESRPRA